MVVAMTADADRVASTLAGIRERNALRALRESSAIDDYAAATWDVSVLLAVVDAVLKHHQPKPLHGLAFGGLNHDKPLCAHDPDTDPDAHFEGDDGLWYCRGKIAGRACVSCADEDAADLWAEWPCPTYLAITTALTGNPASDEHATRPASSMQDPAGVVRVLPPATGKEAGDEKAGT